MVGEAYDASDDSYCYRGSSVLINTRNLRTQAELEAFELEAVGHRSLEMPPTGSFNTAHYRALHRHLFQDVYSWAGEYRTLRTGKGGNWFCYPEYIKSQMTRLFVVLHDPAFLPGADVDSFLKASAYFLGELNAIHPFREGNGRTQLYFLRLLGQRAGHPFRSEAIEPEAFLSAMIQSFGGDLAPLIDELERMQP